MVRIRTVALLPSVLRILILIMSICWGLNWLGRAVIGCRCVVVWLTLKCLISALYVVLRRLFS